MEELEEGQMRLQQMLTQRHVAPFRAEAQVRQSFWGVCVWFILFIHVCVYVCVYEWTRRLTRHAPNPTPTQPRQERLNTLYDTADTLERWIKVQLMWCSLESVFLGGDIAKQMPAEAKKFAKIDKVNTYMQCKRVGFGGVWGCISLCLCVCIHGRLCLCIYTHTHVRASHVTPLIQTNPTTQPTPHHQDWAKMMTTSHATGKVVEAASNEGLRAMLPVMHAELEKCQKSLEGYLEQKRNKFPRFFFVSNPGLLTILSQGSDPLSMNEHYEKVFDALECVEHRKSDRTVIEAMYGDEQRVPFNQPVRAVGNIEDWLADLLKRMQLTMKDLCRACAIDVAAVGNDIAGGGLRRFVDAHIAQFALLGVQLLWTMDCQMALEQGRAKKNIVKETAAKQLAVLQEMSSWCLQDLGSKVRLGLCVCLSMVYDDPPIQPAHTDSPEPTQHPTPTHAQKHRRTGAR